ncbi:MAG: hypothetical protein EP329_18955 [Deltaproteobacteria bacterium]|nr:MAG: hypothetical protein EP329_18955 [Deltaproteobacteria bacterium]
MSYELLWLRAFALTVLIEVPIYTLFLQRFGRPVVAVVLVAIGLQVATHPALWFVAPRFEPYWAWVLTMELLIWLVEGLLAGLAIDHPTGRGRAFAVGLLASLSANATSTLFGLIIS